MLQCSRKIEPSQIQQSPDWLIVVALTMAMALVLHSLLLASVLFCCILFASRSCSTLSLLSAFQTLSCSAHFFTALSLLFALLLSCWSRHIRHTHIERDTHTHTHTYTSAYTYTPAHTAKYRETTTHPHHKLQHWPIVTCLSEMLLHCSFVFATTCIVFMWCV